MDKRLIDIVNSKEGKFNDWIKILNSHNSLKFSYDEITDKTQINNELVQILVDISELFIKYGNFKDTFDNSKMYLNLYGLNLIIKSTKTGVVYDLGIDIKGIYLKTHLRYPDNLKNMDDEFWMEFLKLNEYGCFELVENEGFSDEVKRKNPDLFYNYKGSVFKIFRRYFTDVLDDKSCGDLGDLQITWTAKDNFYDIISNGCLAFKSLYKLNYLLWKIDDLKSKKV